MVSFLCLSMVVPGVAATLEEKVTLSGLEGVWVERVEFNIIPAGIALNLPVQEWKTEVEQVLRLSGIPVLDQAGYQQSEEQPHLKIQGAISQIADNYFAYTILVKLYQQAALLRDRSQPSVMTWSEGSLSTGNVDQIRERMHILVLLFVTDYLDANSTFEPLDPGFLKRKILFP